MDLFFRTNPSPMIDKYGMRVAPQGSDVLERGEPLRFFLVKPPIPRRSKSQRPRKNIRNTWAPRSATDWEKVIPRGNHAN